MISTLLIFCLVPTLVATPKSKRLSVRNQPEHFAMIQCANGQFIAAVPNPKPGQTFAAIHQKVWRIQRRVYGYTIQGWHLGFLSDRGGILSMERGSALWALADVGDGLVSLCNVHTKLFLFHNPKHPQQLHLKMMNESQKMMNTTQTMESGFQFRLWAARNCTSVYSCWGYPEQLSHLSEALKSHRVQKVYRPLHHSYPDTKLLPLHLFMSPKDMSQLSPSQFSAQRTVFRLWAKLPAVDGLILTKDNATQKEAIAFGMHPDGDFEMHPQFDQPTYKGLFDRAFEVSKANCLVYSNGDILFTRELVETATFLQQSLQSTGYLGVGVRINSESREIPDRGWEDVVYDMAENGKQFEDNAEDYFIISRSLWQNLGATVPDFIVGGVAFDNWLVTKAITGGHTVVDCSHTVTAVHLNHGAAKGSRRKPKSPFNIELALEHGGWSKGHLNQCPWFTYRNPITGELKLWTRRGRLVYY